MVFIHSGFFFLFPSPEFTNPAQYHHYVADFQIIFLLPIRLDCETAFSVLKLQTFLMDTISLKFPRKCCFNLPESLNPLQCPSEWITQGDFQITGICTPDLSYFVYILSHHLLYSDTFYFVKLHKHQGLALDSLLGVA